MSIEFSCLSCGKHFEVEDSMGGSKGTCIDCGSPIAVPEPDRSTFVAVDPAAQPRRREPGPVKVIAPTAGRVALTTRRIIIGALCFLALVAAMVALAWPRGRSLAPGTKVMMVSHDKTFKFVDSHYLVFDGNVEPGVANGTEAVVIGPSEKDDRIQCKLTTGPYEGYFGDFDAIDLVPIK